MCAIDKSDSTLLLGVLRRAHLTTTTEAILCNTPFLLCRPIGSGRAAMRFVESLPGLPERTLISSPSARTRYMLHNGRVCALPGSVVEAIRSPLTSPLVIPGARMAAAAAAAAAGLPALAALLAPGASNSAPFEDLSMHSYLSRTGGAGGVHAAEVVLDAVVSGIFAGDVRALSTEAALAPLGALLRAERQAGGMPALLGEKLRAAVLHKLRQLRGSSSALSAAERAAADAAAAAAALEAADSPFVRECATAASVSFTGGMGSLIQAMLAELAATSAPVASASTSASGSGCVVDASALEPSQLSALVRAALPPAPLRAAGGGSAAPASSTGRGMTLILTNARVETVLGGRSTAAAAAAGATATGSLRGGSSSAGASGAAHRDADRSPLLVQLRSSRSRGSAAGHVGAVVRGSGSDAPCAAALADYVISALPAIALAPVLEASAAAHAAAAAGRRHGGSVDSSRAAQLRPVGASSAGDAHAAACLHGAARVLRETPFASLAVVSLGYKGRNLLPPPHIPHPSSAGAASGSAAGAAAAAGSFAGFGYLVPYAERRPAATPQPLPSDFESLAARGRQPSAAAQGRYSGASAGVLGMTWDSTVFPGQAQAHAEALDSGAIAPRRDAASDRVLPGRDVDVAPAVLHGETRVTVMMGGATAADLIEPALPHPTPADEVAAAAAAAEAASAEDDAVPTAAQHAAAVAHSRVDEDFLVYKALRAAAAHVGLPATPDAVCTSVAWSAIPQYTVGHARRVDRAVQLAQTGFADLSAASESDVGRSSGYRQESFGSQTAPRASCRFDMIGNSFRGIGVADSLTEGLDAGRRAADVLKYA